MVLTGVQAAPAKFSHTSGGSTFTYILDNPVDDPDNAVGFQTTLNYTTWSMSEGNTLACVESDDSYAFTDGTTGFMIRSICQNMGTCSSDSQSSGDTHISFNNITMSTSGTDLVASVGTSLKYSFHA
jgi:hypothetical protein